MRLAFTATQPRQLFSFKADGQIKFLRREDDQIKIRGMWVELGEIESVPDLHGVQIWEELLDIRPVVQLVGDAEFFISYCQNMIKRLRLNLSDGFTILDPNDIEVTLQSFLELGKQHNICPLRFCGQGQRVTTK